MGEGWKEERNPERWLSLTLKPKKEKTNPHPIILIRAIYLIFLYESGISQAAYAVLLNFFVSNECRFVPQIFGDKPHHQKSRYKSDECNGYVLRPSHISSPIGGPRVPTLSPSVILLFMSGEKEGVIPSGAPMLPPNACRPACCSMVGIRGGGP